MVYDKDVNDDGPDVPVVVPTLVVVIIVRPP